MKKKILLFASTVLASMALTVSAYALPSETHDAPGDATQILAEALQHTLTPQDVNYGLYDIDGNEPNLDIDVTANDAALAFKNALVKTQFYLEVKANDTFTKNIVLTPYSGSSDSAEAKVKDIVEDMLALRNPDGSKPSKAETALKEKAYETKIKEKVINAIGKIHFYSGSEKVGEVYLTDNNGWAIFGDAVAPMFKDGKNVIAGSYDKTTKTTSGSAQIAALDLPALVADGDLSFKDVQNAYLALRDEALELDETKVPDNIKTTFANAAEVGNAYKKYAGKLTLNEGTPYEAVYEYNRDKDLTGINKIVDDATGIYDYNTVTIAKINEILGTGETFTTADENGETIEVYGTAKVEITGKNTKVGTVRLVKRK